MLYFGIKIAVGSSPDDLYYVLKFYYCWILTENNLGKQLVSIYINNRRDALVNVFEDIR